ncbi:MAG: hypothetical protein GXO14_03350 [Thermococci archaeon]|nr:hypothetical protein [Thermococci archaeon]
MSLYEETVGSRLLKALFLLPVVVLAVTIASSGPKLPGLLSAVLVFVIALEAHQLRITVDEDKLTVGGRLGIIRKKVPLADIEEVEISPGWATCRAAIHFNVPAKACVIVKRKRGSTLSFTTNRPDELAAALKSLGVQVNY